MFGIQVRVIDGPKWIHIPYPAELKEWQDMERMPEFHVVEEAEDWLTDNKASKLEALGFEFQIVPK